MIETVRRFEALCAVFLARVRVRGAFEKTRLEAPQAGGGAPVRRPCSSEVDPVVGHAAGAAGGERS